MGLGIAVLGVVCAVLVARLLPDSQNFVRTTGSRQTLRVFKDPALLALYGVAATAMGAFVAVYNATGFRLAAAPYGLGPGLAGLVFAVYLGSSVFGGLAGTAWTHAAWPGVVLEAGALLLVTLLLALFLRRSAKLTS